MDNQKIPINTGVIILVIIAITAGVFVWVYEKGQNPEAVKTNNASIISSQKMVSDATDKKEQDNSQKKTTSGPPKIVQINSDRSKWLTFNDNFSGIKLKYPPELSIDSPRQGIIFGLYTISPDDARNISDALPMNRLLIYSEQKSIDDIIREQKGSGSENFTQKSTRINNFTATQTSYRGAYAGELWINLLVKNKTGTIVISYPGNNQENKDIFEKVISTITF